MPREDDHVKRAAESQRILRAAREKARKKNGYDSEATRRDLVRLFEDSFKKPAYEWQLDVSEAFLLGLDVVAIAGTGAGKTMPFMMPLLLHRDKYSLVISPLKVLQEDQAKRFEKMGLKAAAVNGDTYSRDLQKELDGQTHNAIFTSPEMCLEHQEFRKWLRDPATGKRVLGSIINEAHCASQWGGDFRPHYALLDKLRVLLPAGSPILATSATLSPAALKDICLSLDLNLDEAFFINLGNDRPNITPSVIEMNSAKDYAAINAHLPKPEDVRSTADLPKGIVFTNAVKKTQIITRHLRRLYHHLPRSSIDFLHAHRTAKAKRRVMRDFRRGKIKILVATEAAGMGADIPDIELIIQFGVPGSLPIWIQRAGRAGRSPELQARAILLVEKSMFQRKKKRKRKGKAKGEAAADPDSSDSGSSSESEDEGGAAAVPKSAGGFYALDSVEEPNDGKVWVKNVDPILREYITTKLCRRDMADQYFSNPPRRPPTGDCCDNCIRRAAVAPVQPQERPTTPDQSSPPSSAHSTPSKNTNANGKRPIVRRNGPRTRRKDHLQTARVALERWRLRVFLERYQKSSVPEAAIMPDPVLTALASRRIDSPNALKELSPSWMLAQRHGEEILEILRRVDEGVWVEKEREKLRRRDERRQATQRHNAASAAAKPKPMGRGRAARRMALASLPVNMPTPASTSSPVAPVAPHLFSAPSTSQIPCTPLPYFPPEQPTPSTYHTPSMPYTPQQIPMGQPSQFMSGMVYRTPYNTYPTPARCGRTGPHPTRPTSYKIATILHCLFRKLHIILSKLLHRRPAIPPHCPTSHIHHFTCTELRHTMVIILTVLSS
ncbi:P-loop containing nucleoside triphosphate hydrolase protein [Mycena maculata]|uniref:DNA 3'-5' helicase n=1 Tax=Mycena maculata TaxID=230809 RepID=A0AAD7NZW2_9AGAR|nr:P-loop containing nucleoside triphosphate hydrolase protein [Mycena maculata]